MKKSMDKPRRIGLRLTDSEFVTLFLAIIDGKGKFKTISDVVRFAIKQTFMEANRPVPKQQGE